MLKVHKKHWLAVSTAALLLSGCASPLYADGSGKTSPGTVPRDEMGEPVWDQVKPTQP